jgi:peptidoglycan/LPS O-acetylase OafA/YrhL
MYFKDLLRFRQAWLGLALLWIVLFHLPLDLGALNLPKLVGYGGVDICFFASGIGCFYSLNADSNIGNFMKRRLRRLAPTYIVFIVIWLSYQYVTGNFNFQMAIGNLFALQNFTGLGDEFNWYISAIFLFYILAPYFVAIVKQASHIHKIMFLLFLIACSIPFWNANTYIITITRLPIFYIGMLFADMCKKDMQITSMHVVCLVAGFILGVVSLGTVYFLLPQYWWSHGLY